MVQKIYSKMHPVSCKNTHHDVTDLVNRGMIKDILRTEQNFSTKYKFCLPVPQMTHLFCGGGNL